MATRTRSFALAVLSLMAPVLPGCQSRPARSRAAALPAQFVAIDERVKVPEKLPAGARHMLDRNGFVVVGNVEVRNLKDGYFAVRNNFITTDAVLYVFHCLFRGGLSAYEKEHLLPLTRRVASVGLTEARKQLASYQGDAVLREPARRNVVFFAVADALLRGGPPSDEARDAGDLVRKITQAAEPGFYPQEDFTSYKPRGAYAADEDLARYFRAMKWFSRVIFPIIRGGTDREPDASIKLRQAYLLGQLLRERDLREPWQKLYDEISFFIARPDSFTPVQLLQAISTIPGPPDDRWVAAVRKQFSDPKYAPSKIVSVPQSNPGDAPTKYV